MSRLGRLSPKCGSSLLPRAIAVLDTTTVLYSLNPLPAVLTAIARSPAIELWDGQNNKKNRQKS